MQFSAGVWTDVTQDVLTKNTFGWDKGMPDNTPNDRVASAGTFNLSLDNSASNSAGIAGYYSPEKAVCRTGFAVGIPVRIVFTLGDITQTKFYGCIIKDGIKPSPRIYGSRLTEVTVGDWLEQASNYEIELAQYTTSQRADQGLTTIVNAMPIKPLSTQFDAGVDTFAYIFDFATPETKAMTEVERLVRSEYGFAYVTPTKNYDEVFTFENRTHRVGATVAQVDSSTQEDLMTEDNNALLTEDNVEIVIADFANATFSDMEVDTNYEFNKNFYNYCKFRVYPRQLGGTVIVLYTLQSPITIPAGGTVTDTRGTYRDPTSAATVGGYSMVTPAGTVDYSFNTKSDGTGTDVTNKLTVNASYGVTEVQYPTLINNMTGGTIGYVTKLNARGMAIYTLDPVDKVQQSTSSQNTYGKYSLSVDMPYQNVQETAAALATSELAAHNIQQSELSSFTFWANRNLQICNNFLELKIGDLIYMTSSQLKDTYYACFIDGEKVEIINKVGIKVTYRLRRQ